MLPVCSRRATRRVKGFVKVSENQSLQESTKGALQRFQSRCTPKPQPSSGVFPSGVPNERIVLAGVEVNATFHQAEQGTETLEPL
jgi:hypothetical protein